VIDLYLNGVNEIDRLPKVINLSSEVVVGFQDLLDEMTLDGYRAHIICPTGTLRTELVLPQTSAHNFKCHT